MPTPLPLLPQNTYFSCFSVLTIIKLLCLSLIIMVERHLLLQAIFEFLSRFHGSSLNILENQAEALLLNRGSTRK